MRDTFEKQDVMGVMDVLLAFTLCGAELLKCTAKDPATRMYMLDYRELLASREWDTNLLGDFDKLKRSVRTWDETSFSMHRPAWMEVPEVFRAHLAGLRGSHARGQLRVRIMARAPMEEECAATLSRLVQ